MTVIQRAPLLEPEKKKITTTTVNPVNPFSTTAGCMIVIGLTIVSSIVLIILGRLFYFIYYERGQPVNDKSKTIKTMIILGSGGHTTEMLRVVKYLNFNNYTPRVYVHADTDQMSENKISDIDNNDDVKVLKIPRSREVGQSYLSSISTTIIACLNSAVFLWFEKPNLILCNGPGTCVPIY
ncbi:UDP-N-acetylglucosamine transferase subunit ALG14 homolog [Aphidius gifuensis]|uniref:UDP-N-acetylglucosamine transferase subunit ALG14 homolog n=1 Tax=Aphidius gifuensis TaxID=684658 RepID=UPI001CDD0760|nr:UDP-N-acetylglucosamine transferase subunit ALG14 homolog [Aphidius gifuensis]